MIFAMKKTEWTFNENELLISKKDGSILKISYKLVLAGMLTTAIIYLLGYHMGIFFGNIIG